jgi:N-acetyl-alpha-D-glucosaminyl L-malate synthase BshA
MNIAIVCYPTVGGSGIVATELAYAFADYGHKVHLISYSSPFRLNKYNENLYYHNVNPPNYPLFEFPHYTLSLTGKISEIIEYENIDIIHCHYAIPHSFSGVVAKEIMAPFYNVKVVTTLHGTDVTLIGTQPNFRRIITYSLNKSDAITCVSEFLYQTTVREFSPKKPIEVVYNFVDTEEYKRLELPELRAKFARENEKIIIHISNFRPVKRVGDVILAFNQIRKKITSKLLLVGDGPDMPKIESLIQKLNLNDSIFCLGEQIAIPQLLSISDLFLMSSEIESFGLAALEALSCKVPVVCYNVGGLKEIVINNVTGYCVEYANIDELANSAIRILKDDKIHQAFAHNGRKLVLEKFDKRIIVPHYLKIFEKLTK